jgi:hypothetical protein
MFGGVQAGKNTPKKQVFQGEKPCGFHYLSNKYSYYLAILMK